MQVVYFIILVGVLIFVHELGHFTWAKIFKVKVHKFSLGFGPKIVSFRRGETEYAISVVPLGGFVRMLGEDPSEVVGPEDKGRAFPDKPLWQRFVIVFAGPAMNLVFPLLLLFVVFLDDSGRPPPTVGRVVPDMPAAQAGLRSGDRILAIDGERVRTFDDLQRIVSAVIGRELTFSVQRIGEQRPVQFHIKPKAQVVRGPLGITERLGRIGVVQYFPYPIVGVPDPTSPAGAAGLRTFDLVTSIDGRPVKRWIDLESALSRARGEPMRLGYLRPESIDLGFAKIQALAPREARVVPDPARNGPDAAGIELAEMYVARIDPASPEYAMGLRVGDRIDALDGHPVKLWREQLVDWLVGASDKTHAVRWTRGTESMSGSFKMHRESQYDEEAGREVRRYVFHTTNWMVPRLDDLVQPENRVTFAASAAYEQTGFYIHLMVTGLVRMAQGKLSFKTVGGPIMLFDIAGRAAEQGAFGFLSMMAFVSINLGVLNLLPVPVLDGGHLLFLFLEAMNRRPVSLRTREIASMVGLSMLVLLMVFAFKNDIERYWDQIAGFFRDLVS